MSSDLTSAEVPNPAAAADADARARQELSWLLGRVSEGPRSSPWLPVAVAAAAGLAAGWAYARSRASAGRARR